MQRLARKFTGTFRCYYRSSKSYSDGLKDGTTITINHSKKDQEVASDLDMEKQLFRLKRAIGSHYSLGKYDEALNVAIQLEEKSLEIFGKSSPVYASSVNNVGLMQKMLGNTEFAMNKYIHALQIYETSVGKQHSSYLSTLTNLGVLYKGIN
jgi:tetratricopeptide (TPR) repeat protein